MTFTQKKASQKGIIFFSIFFFIQLFMQIYRFGNGGEFDINPLVSILFIILICRFYYPLQNLLKAKGLY